MFYFLRPLQRSQADSRLPESPGALQQGLPQVFSFHTVPNSHISPSLCSWKSQTHF